MLKYFFIFPGAKMKGGRNPKASKGRWQSGTFALLYAQRAGHDVRLLVVTMFIRLHPGAQKGNAANYWSLFEPHYKQNIYANPKRTAKFFVLLIGCIQPVICSKILSVPLF